VPETFPKIDGIGVSSKEDDYPRRRKITMGKKKGILLVSERAKGYFEQGFN